jgi:hypothetical protein
MHNDYEEQTSYLLYVWSFFFEFENRILRPIFGPKMDENGV